MKDRRDGSVSVYSRSVLSHSVSDEPVPAVNDSKEATFRLQGATVCAQDRSTQGVLIRLPTNRLRGIGRLELE